MRRIVLVGLCVLVPILAGLTFWFGNGTYIVWHVPAAIMSYLGFLFCVFCCVGMSLGKTWPVFRAQQFCDVGLLFSVVTMLTGALWGHVAWGAYWVWEPRLTGMLLMTLIFASWRLASRIIAKHVSANRAATSILIVLGLPSLAFTHLASRLFGGIHPVSMPTTGVASSVSFLGFACAFGLYVSIAVLLLLRRSSEVADVRADVN